MPYMTKEQLSASLTNINSDVQNKFINDLINAGVYTGSWPLPDSNPASMAEVDTNIGPGTQILLQNFPLSNDVINTGPADLKGVAVNTSADTFVGINGPGGVIVAIGDGNDTVNLWSASNSLVIAGAGNDVLGGGIDGNTLMAGSGNDTLYGAAGNETLMGGSGSSTIYAGSSGAQHLYGSTSGGTAVLYGNGESSLYAGTGNDTLYGAGHDHLFGGDGISGHAVIFGGENTTTESGSAVGGYNILGSGSDSIGGDKLVAGNGGDQLYGGQGADTLVGGPNGTFFGAGGYTSHVGETMQGGAGNDYMYDGGNGNVSMTGGGGDNTFFTFGADTVNDAGGGADTIWSSGTGDQLLVGGDGGNTFQMLSHFGNDTITGGAGNDAAGFKDRTTGDILHENTSGGVTTLVFDNGGGATQTFTISNVETLYFSDGIQHL